MLADKFNEQDQWVKWRLDSAQRDRDDIEIQINTLRSLKEQRADCKYTLFFYIACARKYDTFISQMQIKIAQSTYDFKVNLRDAGRAQIERGNWIGLADPDPKDLQIPTYDIN